MIKHVGKHNNRKVAILYRVVPGEDHMCLIVYSDLIPRMVHDEVMQVLESPVGQQAKELADALFRHTMSDGRNCLQALHSDGYIKKVPTNQVVVTPNATSNVRLDELNVILMEMEKGEEAVKKMAELDRNTGMKGGTKTTAADVQSEPAAVVAETVNNQVSALSDEDIAASLKKQAETMKAQAKTLLEEAKRLEAEAKDLMPVRNAKKEKAQPVQ